MLDKGTTVAGYRIRGVLGRGGMGVVYEATQVALNRTVALKLLAADVSGDVVFRERFQREGQIQAAIDHPHIVPVYEAGESEHGLFLAMRVVRGPNLKDMVVSRELDAGRSLRILGPIADALDAAHGAGLIHRDIKPQNVLVGGRDHAFLADFGLTKAAGEKSLTKTGQFVGTLDYISPEQIRGERATTSSDVYALAALLYECLTGVVPYPKESEAAVLFAHMSDPVPRPTDHRPELPAALDEVLGRAMAKDPGERHTLASELVRDAERAFGRKVRAAFAPPGPIEVPEETGIRQAESKVSTQEARAQETERVPTPTTGVGTPATTEVGAPATTVATPAGATVEAGPATAQTPRLPSTPRPAGTVPATTRPERSVPLVAFVVLIAAVAVVGLLVGRAGTDSGRAAAGQNLVAAGSLELSFPEAWRRARETPALPGMRFADPIAVQPQAQASGALVAGQVAATGPALLPAGFLAGLDGPPARDDAVRLGEFEAYRYRDLRPTGVEGPLTLYVAPTTRGVATVACLGGSGGGEAAGFLRECERAAGSLLLTDGQPFPLGPDARYARTLDGAIMTLGAARRSGVGRLRSARTPRAQARVADRLGTAYGSAAGSLSRTRVSPSDRDANDGIVAALKAAGRGYGRLAAAARAGNGGRYDAARRQVAAGETRVRRALAALESHGYATQ